jgi:hypothetical protein
MRSWKSFFTGMLVSALLIASVQLAIPYWPTSRPTLPRFSRLRVGMTQEEVEATLRTNLTPLGLGFNNQYYWVSKDRRKEIAVEMAEDGTLEQARYSIGIEPLGAGPPLPPQDDAIPESLFDRLRDVIGW